MAFPLKHGHLNAAQPKAANLAKRAALSWSELAPLAASYVPPDQATGPTHSQALVRTFGQPEASVRVTLFRDNHAWCPYCQKVWLWLEEKRVPYRIAKVTMFCYGQKEDWYKRIVPSGMLPAAEIDGRIVTESDVILEKLEAAFGPLGEPLAVIMPQRRLERQLFGAWCEWLCYPSSSAAEEATKQRAFEEVLARMEKELGATPGPWIRGGEQPSTADLVFVPYVERMGASLYYYKGFTMCDRTARPALCRWWDALEARETYRGTQSDFHTHVHDLPPQMGGCYPNGSPTQRANTARVDAGPSRHRSSRAEAAFRESVIGSNPCATPVVVDEALRCALTLLLTGEPCLPPPDSDAALRCVRDRVTPFMRAASPHPRTTCAQNARQLGAAGTLVRTDHSAAPVAVRPLGDAARPRHRFEGGGAAARGHPHDRAQPHRAQPLHPHWTGRLQGAHDGDGNVQPCAQRNAHAQRASSTAP